MKSKYLLGKAKVEGSSVVMDPAGVDFHDYFLTDESYTPAQAAARTAFWANMSKELGAPAMEIWKNRNFAMSPKELLAFIACVMIDFGGGKVGLDKAAALGNYACGAGLHIGYFQDSSAYADVEDYLAPEDVISEGTVAPHNIAELLLELKEKDPAAHHFILCKVFAKALKIKATNDNGYNLTNNPTANAAIDRAKDAIETVSNTVGVTFDAAVGALKVVNSTIAAVNTTRGFVTEHPFIVVGGILALVGGTIYLFRKPIGDVAGAVVAAKLGAR